MAIDIFGSVRTPAWLSPDESTQRWSQIGSTGTGARAFEAGMQRREKKDADLRMEKERALETVVAAQHLAPVYESLRGVDSSPAFLGKIKENPQWLADPYVAPLVTNYGKLIANNEKIQMDATRAQALSIEGKKQLQENASFIKRKSELNSIELGRLEDIQSNGVLNNETRAFEIEKLFSDSEARIQALKQKPEFQSAGSGRIFSNKTGEYIEKPDGKTSQKIPAENLSELKRIERRQEKLETQIDEFAAKEKLSAFETKRLGELRAQWNGNKAAADKLRGGANTENAPTKMTKEKYDSLKSGETYIGNDGKTYQKP